MDTEIRTENAAKPYCQKSLSVDSYIKSIQGKPSVLDFGCGKLRYSDSIFCVASRVTFVDSKIQLNREQIIRGEVTSVRNYIEKHYSNCLAINYESLGNHHKKYNVIICTNVLSAIPCPITISEALAHIRRLLSKSGWVVFVNQHRSSYFKKYESGSKWLYGHLYNGKRGSSYYGILNKPTIEKLLLENGYYIRRSWCVGESTYTEAASRC